MTPISREDKIIDLLRESDKSFTELNEGDELLKNESTLSNHIKKLKKLGYIDDYKVDHPKFRSRYRLTEKYHRITQEQNEKSQIEEMMFNRSQWQAINKRLTRYLEAEHPYLNQISLPVTYRELFGDMYSYLKYFDFSKDRIEENYRLLFDLALYFVYTHPDKKYDFISKYHDFEVYKFADLIDELKESDKIVEFILKKNGKLQEEKYYMLHDDPILHLIRQKIETYFQKFIIFWEFPEAELNKNFDFLLQFSNFIYDEVRSSSTTKTELQEFFYKFKICFMTYIREYIFRFLDRVKIAEDEQNDTLPPLQLLPNEQKMKYWSKYLLSPQMISNEEKKTFEKFIFLSELNRDKKIEYLEEIVIELVSNIKDIFNSTHKKLILHSAKLESHLLFLLRIYQKYDSEYYQELKRKLNEDKRDFNLSYSYISEDIFKKIKENKIGLTDKANFDDITFLIRQITERLDHLVNIIENDKKTNIKGKKEISEIIDIIEKSLDKKYIHPIYKKIVNIYLKGYELVNFERILDIIQFLFDKYPKDIEIGILLFKLFPEFKDIILFKKILQKNKWDLTDKIIILENSIQKMPIEFDIPSFLNIQSSKILEEFDLIKEKDREKHVKLLKIYAIYFEKKNEKTKALLYFLLATEREIERLDPYNEDNKLDFIRNHGSLDYFELNYPAYLNLIRLYRKNTDNILDNLEKNYENYRKLYNSFNKRDPEISFLNLIKNLPYLINLIMKFSILISLKAKNEEIKNANLIINSVNEIISIEHEFEEYSDIKEEQKLLNNISSQLEEFLKRNKNSVFSILKFFISAYSNDKHFDISNYELFDHNVLRPNFSNLNHTFGPNDFYNPLLLDQKLINDNYNYVTFYNLLRNPPILSLEENRFNKIRNIFFNLFEDEDYVFKVVFPKKYKVPVNWDKNKWKNLKRYLEDDLYQLMEALDINLYSSNSNLFEFQKDLILLIFKNYGVEWALEYLDNYINYLRWYYIRMDQLDVLTRFFVNNFEDFKLILEFIRNFLKSLLFWEYRDREKAKIFLDKTKDIIEKLDIKMEDYKGPDILNSYFHQYQDLFTKIMI